MRRSSTAMILALAAFGGLAASPALAATEAELEFWRSAQTSGQVEDYRAYLRQYPNGEFRELAENRITAAERDAAAEEKIATAPQVEAGLNLRWTERRDIQRALTRQGYDTRGVDGVFGQGTRSAIRNWQGEEGFAQTGYLTAGQADQLLLRQTTAATTTPEANQSDNAPVYVSASEARSIETGLLLSAEEKRDIQRGLRGEGFYRGAIDGVFGSGTRGSIRDWQISQGETATGYLTASQARSLEVKGDATTGSTVAAVDGGDDLDAYERRLSKNQRAEVEQRLIYAGFDPGKVNGKFGPTARDAIFNYRSSRDLERHQYVDRQMIKLLVNETQAEFSQNVRTGQVDPEVAAAVAAGALLVGGAILLSD